MDGALEKESSSTVDENTGMSLEARFIRKLRVRPEAARLRLLDGAAVACDVANLLQRWSMIERTHGTALQVASMKLSDPETADGMKKAILTIGATFQELGKLHVGMSECLMSQNDAVLGPMVKEHRKQIQEWTTQQVALQKTVGLLLQAVERAEEKDSALAVQQASVKYEKQARAQREGVREYLSHMLTLWMHRMDVFHACAKAMDEANQEVLNFYEDAFAQVKTAIDDVNVHDELCKDVLKIVKVDFESPAQLAGAVYEALGDVEPDIASASVDAAVTACSESIILCKLMENILWSLGSAFETRANDLENMATGLKLEFLNSEGPLEELYSQEVVKDTERHAWRMLLLRMRQSALVLADLGGKLLFCVGEASKCTRAEEGNRKQILAARSAAHKELQLVAQNLKDSKLKLEQCDESIQKAGHQRERALSEAGEIKSKIEKQKRKRGESRSDDDALEESGDDNSITGAKSSSKNSESVVKRLFRMKGTSLTQNLAEAEERAFKSEEKLITLQTDRAVLQNSVHDASDRLEAQIKAFAVQIAGTLSAFVSSHQSSIKSLKEALELAAQSCEDFGKTMFQMSSKMMKELHHIGLKKDIETFLGEQDSEDIDTSEDILLKGFPSMQARKTMQKGEKVKEDSDMESCASGGNEVYRNQEFERMFNDDGKSDPSSPRLSPFPKKHRLKLTESETLMEEFGLPAGEAIVASFSCAYLPGKVPQQGRLVLTKAFLCFSTLAVYEPMFGGCKVVVRLADVAKVSKAATAWGLVANALVVRLEPLTAIHDSSELVFTSFFYRDRCYDRIVQLSAVNREIRSNEEIVKKSLPGKNVTDVGDGDEDEDKGKEAARAGVSEAWKELDPRSGERYKGNKLILLAPSQQQLQSEFAGINRLKRKKGAGFFRVRMSTENQSEDGVDMLPEGADSSQRICPTCEAKISSKPCSCWKPGMASTMPRDHSELHESFWGGNLDECASKLWLGAPSLARFRQREFDLSKDLGASNGDFDQKFGEFNMSSNLQKDLDSIEKPSTDHPEPTALFEGDEKQNDPVLHRVVSFSHPLGQTPWGKQTARSTQVQRVFGLLDVSNDSLSLSPDAKQVVMVSDTALAGFPYADHFIVRTRFELTEMASHEAAQETSWCRLKVSCKLHWLKSVSVPFLKGKIEKENIATGKKNMAKWAQLAKAKLSPDSNALEDDRVAAEDVDSNHHKKWILICLLEGFADPSFLRHAVEEASSSQKLIIVLLLFNVIIQLLF